LAGVFYILTLRSASVGKAFFRLARGPRVTRVTKVIYMKKSM
jgi:hypothetical protein